MGKKKGGANKLAKMSEEERARYLQHRADIEEEARRRKQQLISIFLKNKLKREEAFSRLNMAKINQEWRTILRNVKCTELRNEAKNVQTYFIDAFQRKNQTIRRLQAEIDEQEEMYVSLLDSHMQTIERFIDLHSNRLDYWTYQYEKEKKILFDQYQSEMKTYKERKFKAHKELECVYHSLENKNDTQKMCEEKVHSEKVDIIKSQMILKLRNLSKRREEEMNGLWTNFQTMLRTYAQNTEEKYAEYTELRNRDNADTKDIHQHYLDIARATDDLSYLKSVLESIFCEHEIHINQLHNYQKLLLEKQRKFKWNMSLGDKMDKERMKKVVICSTRINTVLDKYLGKSKNILLLSTVCSKYETECEKVQPFKSSNVIEYDQEKIDDQGGETFKEATLGVMFKMEHFWIKYKNVEIDCLCLEEDRSNLKSENEFLKEKLRKYLQNIAVSDNRIDLKERPHSMKIERKGISACTHQKRNVHLSVTGIEGNLSVAIRSQQLKKFAN